MDERKRGMMRGEMWGDSDEQAIMMIDTAVEVRAMEGVAGRIEIKKEARDVEDRHLERGR